ncbi:MBL fold metallo-hydrolase [Lachnoclostridium sp. An169]|uniref:MBL fold metallo-hydrolase n=1 Tax=Lachnoclostridium sp. An169 TaxID=1965569 RepID=UPI000B36E2AD|nr:MBL fold metallo-hydrolase [Lachnoclostridium sp. An169]OUP80564.1 MBL fold metallo-hydrolase [Lachnoclostridium sp. An169]HJA64696.1 MBL fold metallo-hydrolase [Candidatus Mediterraneibacter cottocaccae]
MESSWFTTDQIDKDTFVISEYRHWEETHCYLLTGKERGLLIDTGLGISDIYGEVMRLTDKPVTAAVTHTHWDHIGGLKYFPDFYCHMAEQEWISGKFPLPVEKVRQMVSDCDKLPEGFRADDYDIFQGKPTKLLEDYEEIDLGRRKITVLHTPGHSPGHMCFWEKERGYLFTGDLVYQGTLYADYPSTDPQAYLASLEKIAVLPVERIFPGHHSLDIRPELMVRMRDELRKIDKSGRLKHGSGLFEYGDWAVRL